MVAALEGCDRVAFTVVEPSFSGMDDAATVRVASGAASSSRMVSVTSEGWVTSGRWLLAAVPEIVTLLFGASVLSFTAVTVTVPLLVVSPAAMVSVFAAESWKFAATAPAPGAAATVTVVAAPEARFSRAVTVVTFEAPLSSMPADDSSSVTSGGPSSSRMVRVLAAGFATPRPPVALPETVTRMLGSSAVLSTAVTVTRPVLAVAPAAMVSVLVVLCV